MVTIHGSRKQNKWLKLVLFPLISGVVYGLSWNYDFLFYFQILSLVPLLFSLDYIRQADNKLRKKIGQLFLVSLLFKIPIDSLVLVWMFDYSVVALIVLWITDIILFTALFLPSIFKKIPFFVTVLSFVLYELLMQKVTTLVPFYQLGYSWGDIPQLIQYYAIIGVEGGSLILYAVNFAIFSWVKNKQLRLLPKIIGGLFLTLTICSVLYFYLSSPMELNKNDKISLIHCDISTKDSVYRTFPLKLIDSVAQVAKPNSLVVLPEVFFNSFGWANGLSKNRIVQHIDSIEQKNNQIYLTGAYLLSTTNHPTPQSRYYKKYNVYYNANNVSLLINHDIVNVKSKRRFIPFFEYVPDNPIAQWINRHISTIGDDRKVTILNRTDHFSYKNKRFNTLLCYESVYPMMVAHHAKGQQFVIVQANEKWNTSELLSNQYFKLNKACAVQIGIPVYRSSNTGYSAIIYPNGTTKYLYNTGKHLSLLEGNLPKEASPSFYCSIIGWTYWSAGIGLIVLLIMGLFRKETNPLKRSS